MKQVQINTILPKNIKDNNNGLNYTLHGDYYLPDLYPRESDSIPLGHWGREYKLHLESNRSGLYTRLILSGKLYSVLHDLDYQAQKRYELILCQMKTAEGITESLKAKNQLEWVRRMIDRKIPLRKVLLVTQRHVVGYMAKGGEGYVKIHDRRTCKALQRHGPNSSVL